MLRMLWVSIFWFTASFCSTDPPALPSPSETSSKSIELTSFPQIETSISDRGSISSIPSPSIESVKKEEDGVLISDLFKMFTPTEEEIRTRKEAAAMRPSNSPSNSARMRSKKLRPNHPPPSPPNAIRSISESSRKQQTPKMSVVSISQSDNERESLLLSLPPSRSLSPQLEEGAEFDILKPSPSTEQLVSTLHSTVSDLRNSNSNSKSLTRKSGSRYSTSMKTSSRTSASVRSFNSTKRSPFQSPTPSYSAKNSTSTTPSPKLSSSSSSSGLNPSIPIDTLILPTTTPDTSTRSIKSSKTKFVLRDSVLESEPVPVPQENIESRGEDEIVKDVAIKHDGTIVQLLHYSKDSFTQFKKGEGKNLPNTPEEEDENLDLSTSLRQSESNILDIFQSEEEHRQLTRGIGHDMFDIPETGKQPELVKIGKSTYRRLPIIKVLAKKAPYFLKLLSKHKDLLFFCTHSAPYPFSVISALPFSPIKGISVFVPKNEDLMRYSTLTIERLRWILLYHFVREIINIDSFDSSGHYTFETLLSDNILMASPEYFPNEDGMPKVLMDRPQRIAIDIAQMMKGMNTQLESRMSIKLDGYSVGLTHSPIICSNGVVFFTNFVLTIPSSIPHSISSSHCLIAQFELMESTIKLFGGAGITVFAISHSVWDAFIRDLSSHHSLEFMTQRMIMVSLFHTIPQPLYSDSFYDGLEVSSCLPDQRIHFEYNPDGEYQWYVNGCAIVSFNNLFCGGVIHCVDRIMKFDGERKGDVSPRGSSKVSSISMLSTANNHSNSSQSSPRSLQTEHPERSNHGNNTHHPRRALIQCPCCHCILL